MFRSAVLFITRLKWQRMVKKDVVIFDAEGSGILKEAVLYDTDCYVLKTRNEEFPINIEIVIKWVCNLFSLVFRKRMRGRSWVTSIGRCYFLSVLQFIAPKVVVTFIDNSSLFQWLSRNYKEAVFYAVQNGLRAKDDVTRAIGHSLGQLTTAISMPHFFCFGEYEKELYEQYGHVVDNYYPVGSLKGSFFQERYGLMEMPAKYDICLISQWRKSVMLGKDYPEIKKATILLIGNLKKIVQENSFSLVVALAAGSEEEKEWFSNAFDASVSNIAFTDRHPEELHASYVVGMQSRLCICCFSTLGFELLGFGQKILFADYSGEEEFYSTPCPDICYTNVDSHKIFETKVIKLLNMKKEKFLDIIKPWQPYRMNYSPEKPTHIFIREMVASCLGRDGEEKRDTF